MARHIGIQFFMACAAAIIGCTSEQIVQPIAHKPPAMPNEPPPAMPNEPSDTVVFTSTSFGWQPASGDVKAGGIVVWRIGPDGGFQEAANQAKIYLLNMNGTAVLDSLYLKNGSVTHTFAAPGAHPFCSGLCWDPPDGGIVYVH